MKNLIYLSATAISLFLSGNALANNSQGMAEVDFKQFVCGYLEFESDRDAAVDMIESQIGSIISSRQQQTLNDIRQSNSAVQSLCSNMNN